MRPVARILLVALVTTAACGESPRSELVDSSGSGIETVFAGKTDEAVPPEGADDDEGRLADGPRFSDITESAGVRFVHFNDASPNRYLPETMGSGAAFLDYDGDGDPDLYLVNGAPLEKGERAASWGALYRNLDNGRFVDVTRAAGLDVTFYGMGAAVGDVDNDGHLDLFVTGLGGCRLFRNRGDGTFEDVTEVWGLADAGFGSSAAFLDFDRDGYLDLFAGRYVEWSPETDVACVPDGVHRTYCTPEVYAGQTNRLYRNRSGARFEDVTRASGVHHPEGKTLGVVIFDHNQDGWPDIAVANDTVRNFLFLNNRDGTFSESGVLVGIAYSDSGATRGGMGIDAADVEVDGYSDLVIGNFSQEMAALYRSSPQGFFVDQAAQAGIGVPTLMSLAFGTLFEDFDGDGLLDLIFANGHIEPDIAQTRATQSYEQPLQLFLNKGGGRFELVEPAPNDALGEPLVGRGLASADVDADGDPDLVVTQNGGSALLLRNNAPPRAWLRVELVGRASNRTGYGATVRAVSGSKVWTRQLVSGRSYLSASEPVLTLRFGSTRVVDRVDIVWPSGVTQTLRDPALGETLTVLEPRGAPK